MKSIPLERDFNKQRDKVDQTKIATEKFCPKSLLQNEIDFIESHIQILHHLKIVLRILMP